MRGFGRPTGFGRPICRTSETRQKSGHVFAGLLTSAQVLASGMSDVRNKMDVRNREMSDVRNPSDVRKLGHSLLSDLVCGVMF